MILAFIFEEKKFKSNIVEKNMILPSSEITCMIHSITNVITQGICVTVTQMGFGPNCYSKAQNVSLHN